MGYLLLRAVVWGLPQASWTSPLREIPFLLPQIPACRNETGLGCGPSVDPCLPSPALTCRPLRSSSEAQPARFRAAEVLPRPPHPTSCKSLLSTGKRQAQEIQRAISGCGKEKPQQLPPNWHSKQLQASKCRNELNKPFFPLEGGVQAPGLHPSHTLAAAIYKI